MYIEYFKLSEPPFSLTPDPRFLYMSERHREGLAHLFYGVQQPGGFVQLTGEIGSGKTTLCRCLVKQLPPGTDIALILNPRLTVLELLATVCDELGIPYPAENMTVKVLIDALNKRLLESHAQGKRTVLIIDEAQNLDEDVLEQVRLLTNLETSKEKLLQIILIGQPELLTILRRRKLRQLAQRITARYHLSALTKKETDAYIQHRLLVAGRREPLFTKRAMRLVYRLSRGVPRAINIICDRALLGAYAMNRQRVTASIVRRAGRETEGILPWRRTSRYAFTAGFVILAALAAAAVLYLTLEDRFPLHAKRGPASVTGAAVSAESKTPPGPSPLMKAIEPNTSSQDETGVRKDSDPGQASPQPLQAQPALTDVLARAPAGTRGNFSFANLYVLMGIKLPLNPSDLGCADLRTQGYDCLSLSGNWLKLRRYDLPAILEIVLPNGTRKQAALISLVNETATLAIGNWTHAFPLSEISQVWDGSFLIVWKPPFPMRQLSVGHKGKEVTWLRNALDLLEGKQPDPEGSDLFDDDLRQRVLSFQRSQSLIQDGVVGSETLVRLTVALQGSGAPSLSRRTGS